jgi:hypothetical protein
LQTLTEFDVFVKSFSYLVQHLTRNVFLEPFDVDAMIEPIEFTKSQLEALTAAQANNYSAGVDYEKMFSVADKISSSTGRPPADVVHPPVDAPLSEAESDMFPCMLAMIGSGFGLIKVTINDMNYITGNYLSIHHLLHGSASNVVRTVRSVNGNKPKLTPYRSETPRSTDQNQTQHKSLRSGELLVGHNLSSADQRGPADKGQHISFALVFSFSFSSFLVTAPSKNGSADFDYLYVT